MHSKTGTTQSQPTLRYWCAGDTGPRVLLVMGFRMAGSVWEPQIEGLKATHQVAWFDNRGVGESARGHQRRWTMVDMANDAMAVMEALGWTSCHVVGVSMGGMVAQEMALRWPDRVSSLSLIVSHAGGVHRDKVPTLKGLRAFARLNGTRGDARVQALKTLLYPKAYLGTIDERAMDARMKARMHTPPAQATALGQLSAILRHNTSRRLHALSAPTLIIKASQDILIRPTASDRLKRLIPHATMVDITDAGHGVTFQGVDAVNEALMAHFARV